MKKVYSLILAFVALGAFEASAQSVKDSFEIYFEFNKAILKKESKAEIDSFLKLTGERRIMTRIVGHTCDIGTDDYNMKLSEDRAKSAFEYLRGTGEPEQKTELLFYGKSQQKYDLETREKNRRVFFQYTLEDDDRDTLLKNGCFEVFVAKGTYQPGKNRDVNFELRNISNASAFKSAGLPVVDDKGKRLFFNSVVFFSSKLQGSEKNPGQAINFKMPLVNAHEPGFVLYRLEDKGGKQVWVNTGKACEGVQEKDNCKYYPQDMTTTGYCACAKERMCEEDCAEDPFGGERSPNTSAPEVKVSNLKTVVRFASADAANNKEIFEDTQSRGIKGYFQEDMDLCAQFMAGITTDEWFPNYYQDAEKAKRNIIVKNQSGGGQTLTVYVPRGEVKDLAKPILISGTRNASRGFIRWDRDKFEPKTCLGPVNCEYHVFEVPATGNYKLTERVENAAPKKETEAILKTRVLKNSTVYVGNKQTNYVYKAANAKRKNKIRAKEYALIKFEESERANIVVLVQHTTKRGRKSFQEARLSELRYKKRAKMYIMRKRRFTRIADFKDMNLTRCK